MSTGVAPYPSPQHLTPPAAVSAQAAWPPPAVMAVTPLVRPDTAAGTVTPTYSLGAEPFPIWPKRSLPQHLTPPAVVSAHAVSEPAVIAVTLVVNAEASTGVEPPAVEPMPSWTTLS